MKNIIKFVICILLIISGMCFFNNSLLSDSVDASSRGTYLQTLKAEEMGSIDVIFLGDSTIMNSVIPVQLWKERKITSFNIGFAGAQPDELYYAVKQVFKNQNPKCIVIESSCIYSKNELPYKTGYPNNVARNISHIDMFLTENLAVYCPLMKQKSIIKTQGFEYMFKLKTAYKINDINKGYKKKDEIVPLSNDYKNEDMYYFVKDSAKYTNEMKSLCKDNNCELVFITVPQITKWNESISKQIAEFLKKNNLKTIDFNKKDDQIKNFDWKTDTCDGGTHLNFSGATKTTKAIGDYLVNELGMEPTKLTKEQAEKWDNDTKLFYEAIKKE